MCEFEKAMPRNRKLTKLFRQHLSLKPFKISEPLEIRTVNKIGIHKADRRRH